MNPDLAVRRLSLVVGNITFKGNDVPVLLLCLMGDDLILDLFVS